MAQVNGFPGLYVTCEKCGGDGYQPLFGKFYYYPCRGCGGSGERERAVVTLWRMLRRGAKSVAEGEY